MKKTILIFIYVILSLVVFAQSKKEQIQSLTFRVDSINTILSSERNFFTQKEQGYTSKVSNLENQVASLKTEIDIINKNLSGKYLEIKNLNNELIKTKNENERIIYQLKTMTDSIKQNIQLINNSKLMNELPFIGLKQLGEFWDVGSGSGEIAMYKIEIMANADLFLIKQKYYTSFDSLSKENKFYVGKYTPIIKGIGEFDKNEYYKITDKSFIIVDENGNPLKLSGCCNQHDVALNYKLKCICNIDFY